MLLAHIVRRNAPSPGANTTSSRFVGTFQTRTPGSTQACALIAYRTPALHTALRHCIPHSGGEDFIPTTVELEPAEVERTASEAHTRALEVSSAGMLPHSDIEAIAVDANLAINYIRAPVEPRAAAAAARRGGGDDRIAIVEFESAGEELAATVERHLSNEENVATVEPQLAEEERFATVEPQLAEEEHFATVEEHAGLGEGLALGAIQSAEHLEAFRSTGLKRTRGRFYRAVVAGTALALALATAYLASQLAGDVNVLTKDTAM